jgi:hypothetical protein
LLPEAGGGDIVAESMETVVMRRGGMSKSPARCAEMTRWTMNSTGSPLGQVNSKEKWLPTRRQMP